VPEKPVEEKVAAERVERHFSRRIINQMACLTVIFQHGKQCMGTSDCGFAWGFGERAAIWCEGTNQ